MARIACVLLLLCVFNISGTAKPTSSSIGEANYVKTSCRSTTYPAICVRALSAYTSTIQRSPQHMALTALAISLTRAKSCKSFVRKFVKFKNLKSGERKAINDCLDGASDTVDRLSKLVKALTESGQSKSQDFAGPMSTVEGSPPRRSGTAITIPWVSAALTGKNTCTDGFAGKAFDDKIKDSVRAQIVSVAQHITNAICLVNQYGSKH